MHHLIPSRVWDGEQVHGRMQLKESGRRDEVV